MVAICAVRGAADALWEQLEDEDGTVEFEAVCDWWLQENGMSPRALPESSSEDDEPRPAGGQVLLKDQIF